LHHGAWPTDDASFTRFGLLDEIEANHFPHQSGDS